MLFVTNLFMGIAFLASLTIYFTGNTYSYLRLFPLFLLITGIAVVIGVFLAHHDKSNTVLYNLLITFEFCYYIYILFLMVQNKAAKAIIRYVSPGFAVLAAFNMAFLQKTGFNSMTYALGALLVVVIGVYYLFELFQQSQPVNVARLPAFWICAGLIFFYACAFPLFGLANFMRSAPQVIIKNLRFIINLLNVFLYSSFTIAFLCRIRVRNSTS